MRSIYQSLAIFLCFTIITGLLYPALITAIGQIFFFDKSQGSLIKDETGIRGSFLLAQKFTSDQYFWPRPSASDFRTIPSLASNFGPTNKILKSEITKRTEWLLLKHKAQSSVPEELVTSSASGLDPHISPEAAHWQAKRVADARNWGEIELKKLTNLIDKLTEGPDLTIFGEKRILINRLNLQTDQLIK